MPLVTCALEGGGGCMTLGNENLRQQHCNGDKVKKRGSFAHLDTQQENATGTLHLTANFNSGRYKARTLPRANAAAETRQAKK